MRICLESAENKDLRDALELMIPMLLAPATFVPSNEAEVVVSDGVSPISSALETGKYAIHYCMDRNESHPPEWKQSPLYRFVQNDEGEGIAIAAQCLMSIARQTKSADAIHDR